MSKKCFFNFFKISSNIAGISIFSIKFWKFTKLEQYQSTILEMLKKMQVNYYFVTIVNHLRWHHWFINVYMFYVMFHRKKDGYAKGHFTGLIAYDTD